MSNRSLRAALVSAAFVTIASTSQAGVIFEDTFEYANQTAFDTAWPIAVTPGATLSTLKNNTAGGAKSASVASGSSGNNRKSFTDLAIPSTTPIMWSYDFYDNTGTGNPQKAYARLADTTTPAATNQYVSMGTYNNLLAADQGGNYYMAKILGGAGNGGSTSAWFKLNDSGAPLRSAGWHNLKVVITGLTSPSATEIYKFYVDNILSEQITVVGTQRQYDNVAIGNVGETAGILSYYDNMRLITDALAVVPTAPNHNGDSSVGTDNGGGGVDVGLDWAVNGNDKWDLYLWKTLTESAPSTPTIAGLTSSDANALNLDPDTQYSWRVDGINLFDDKATGNVWSFTTTSVPEPASIGLVALAATSLIRRRRA
jgi:hypothetical protein